MSWQLGAFSILALSLAAGFAWYERTRPDARILALVGTLAAFAALGRIAFAALPNVKPTTDIVLISGYALGGAPGFVVGALAGLTSNFFFGQGPWTPWQMFAWGAVGLIGATIGWLATRGGSAERPTLPRWPLALICALVGFAFTAFQDFGDWVTYSDHSLAQLGIYVGKGIGFDFVHAAGCFAFALAFGPALGRSLFRLRARLNVSWQPAGAVPAVVAIALLAGGTSLAGAAPARAASPASYLMHAQHHDGGFGSAPRGSSSELYTGWAALGLASLGHNPADVRHGGASALGYVRAGVGSIPDVGSLERTILIVRAAGDSASSFSGHDLLAALQRQIRADGSVSEQANLTAFAVLALRSSGVAPPAKTLAWLIAQQDRDGGFNFATAGGASDPDDTGAVLEALAGVGGAGSRARAHAIAYLRAQQNPDRGFPADSGGESNAQSTAWAIQGLVAARVDLGTLRHGSPLRFLRSLIESDGHVRYSRTTDQTPVWVTAEAVMALARKSLPLAPVAHKRSGRRADAASAGSGGGLAASGAGGSAGAGGASSARSRAHARSVGEVGGLLGFAAEAGAFTALVLAPVGVG